MRINSPQRLPHLRLTMLIIAVNFAEFSGFDTQQLVRGAEVQAGFESHFDSPPPDTSSSQPLIYIVTSEHQPRPVQIQILVPDSAKTMPDRKFPVLYVLPVEAEGEHRWGDPVREFTEPDLHNRHQLIVVFLNFVQLPWYANHPSDPQIQQERFLIESVIPFVEQHAPAESQLSGRLLVGFSKSGWGAMTLLLRHPDLFAAAAVFDAPLMMQESGKFGSGSVFGSQENFELYRLTDLIRKVDKDFKSELSPPRMAFIGGGNFQMDHDQFTEILAREGLAHVVLSNINRDHSWNSGWVSPAVEWLAESHTLINRRRESNSPKCQESQRQDSLCQDFQ
ncbi:MAG: hypothetical protein JNL58_29350 [Planctomyces sp.]|nr:hypothetical protein [Planctomyces sp.]